MARLAPTVAPVDSQSAGDAVEFALVSVGVVAVAALPFFLDSTAHSLGAKAVARGTELGDDADAAAGSVSIPPVAMAGAAGAMLGDDIAQPVLSSAHIFAFASQAWVASSSVLACALVVAAVDVDPIGAASSSMGVSTAADAEAPALIILLPVE